jgi:hypothetical protein
MHYDAAKRRLHIGKGYVDNVPPEANLLLALNRPPPFPAGNCPTP